MSVWDRAARLTDEAISAQDDQQRELLRQACEQHLSDLCIHQRTKLKSFVMQDERDDLPRAARVA